MIRVVLVVLAIAAYTVIVYVAGWLQGFFTGATSSDADVRETMRTFE